ncbi:hypothetical protein HC031_02900 [Planosporangium thailandense]|uniref:DUF11 domain-containing protein n=1 Tax=Planosporangium thailandense TaxID=765197 RepID=A0ABX0XTX0_9ACTN|nr:DUF11 domain-containing protein [Planosporangium thailandense]NJC68678.1 hypothetical protein [Planosporangium thailandense]
MRLHQGRALFRLGAGAVAAAAATSVVAMSGTARAADTGADLSVTTASTAVVQGAGKPFAISVHNDGPETATGIRLTIDISKLDTTKLEVLESDSRSCTVDGTTITCAVPDLPAGGNYNAFEQAASALPVLSIGDPGDAGSFDVKVTSDTPDADLSNNEATGRVTVVADNPEAPQQVDLVAWSSDVYAKAGGSERIKPGQTGELMWMLLNQAGPVKGVSYMIALPPYLTFASQRPECSYEAENSVAICHDPDAIVYQGDVYGSVKPDPDGNQPFLPDPVKVKLAANAPGPVALGPGVVIGFGDGPAPVQALAQRASAATSRAGVISAAQAAELKKTLKSSDVTPDADPADNMTLFSAFTAANPADLSISATPVSGHVGDTVKVKVTVANGGPADVMDGTVTLTAPAGTEFVSVDPDLCTATTAGKVYSCDLGFGPAHTSASNTFSLKILSDRVSDGKVEVSSSTPDPKPGNNVGAIKVTVLTGTQPSPGTSPSTSPSASAAPSASATPGTGGGGGGTGGGLPVTGTPVLLIGGLGLGVAAVGGVLMVLARRRREGFMPPID